MFTFNLESTLSQVIDLLRPALAREVFSLLNKEGRPSDVRIREGYLLTLEFRVDHPNNSDEYRYARYHLLFFGNTSVFYANASGDGSEWRVFTSVPVEEWINTSNHSSCWRSDGFRFMFDLYIDMCEDIDSTIAPINFGSTVSFGIGTVAVKVKVTYKTCDDYGYTILKLDHAS